MKSYPYQSDIINICISTTKNVLVMLPTGGGKTHIASEVALKSEGKILFVAPKINLLTQTEEDFKHLDPQTIHGNKSFDKEGKVFITTIQTISRRPDLLKEMQFDTIIIDEVHYGSNGKMQEVIKANHDGRVIGLSATPYDSEGKVLEGYDIHIDEYDMNYLISKGYLTPVEAVCPLNIDLSGIKITGGDYNITELDYRMSTAKMISTVIGATVNILKEKKKTIVFAVSIEHADKLATAYRKVFAGKGIKKTIRTLHSGVDKHKRNRILLQFIKGNVDMLISVDMITTGFNAPPTDSMVLARPTRSQNLYKQMVGRGTRNFKGKKFCLLIDCGNVVESLGMPLDPIVYIKKKKSNTEFIKRACPVCKWYGLKKISGNQKGELFKICPKCGKDEEPYQGNNIDKCSKCDFAHTYKTHEKQYIINQYGIALKCKGCKTITPLSFFNIGGIGGKRFFVEHNVGEVIAEHLFEEKPIFFKEVFIKYVIMAALKKKRTYIKIMFGNDKENKKFQLIKEEITNGIDIEKYNYSIGKLDVSKKRKSFVNFCHNYTRESKRSLLVRVLQLEKLYKEKYSTDMEADMYKKSALAHIKYFKENSTLP